jgi:hypothetical protein
MVSLNVHEAIIIKTLISLKKKNISSLFIDLNLTYSKQFLTVNFFFEIWF